MPLVIVVESVPAGNVTVMSVEPETTLQPTVFGVRACSVYVAQADGFAGDTTTANGVAVPSWLRQSLRLQMRLR